MVMQSQNAFALCVKLYFSTESQQAICWAQTVGGRYLSNLCIVRCCLPGTSEMCIHANRLNEKKKKVFCSSPDFCSLEVRTATRNGRKTKSQTPAVWCHISCLCKCISSWQWQLTIWDVCQLFSGEWRGGGTFIHIHSCLWSLLGSSN